MPDFSLDFSSTEHSFMQRALDLAQGALYISMPNPRLGGTQPAGFDHAEVQALKDCVARGHEMNEVMVEAGARLNGALLQAGVVDEIVLYQAQLLLGDAARGMAQFSLTDLSQKRVLTVMDQRNIGPDLRRVLR